MLHPSRGRIAAALLAALMAVVVHLNTLGNDFALDDRHIVLENESIHSLSSLPGAMRSPYWQGDLGRVLGLWRPVSTALFGSVWVLSDGSPLAFHAVNVLLHAAVTAAVVLLLARILPLGAAAGGGLVFATHPVHVEAVANVVGAAELLSALLFVLACLVWIRGSAWPSEAEAAQEGGGGHPAPAIPFQVPGVGRVAPLVLLYAGAFLAKEGAVVLPAVLPLLDGARRPIPLRHLRLYLGPRAGAFALLGVTAAAILAARYFVLWSIADPLPPPGAALLREIPRIWTVAGVWPEYFRLLFFPVRLSSDYAPLVLPVVTVWTWRGILGVALVLGSLLLSFVLWRTSRADDSSRRSLPFGVLWFALTVAPVSNLLFLSGVLLAERNLYLPSVGFAAAAGWALHGLVAARPRLGALVTGIVVALFGIRTLARNPVWGDTDTVTTRLILEHPEGGRAQWALGALYESEGAVREANAAYRRAVGALDRDYALLVDLGRRLMNQRRDRAAAFLLEEAVRTHPSSPNAAELLAVLRARGDDPREAERWARLATALNPANPVSWHLLSSSLETQGRIPESVRARQEVIRRGEGGRWQQWLALARLHQRAGDTARALTALDSARSRAGSAEVARRIDSLYRAAPPTASRP